MKITKHHALLLILFFAAVFLLFAAPELIARAGGAGGDIGGGGVGGGSSGGSSSGGGGGGDGEGIVILIQMLIRVILMLPYPANIIVAAGIIIVFLIFSYQTKKKFKAQTILNRLPAGEPVKTAPGYQAFLKNNPDFDETTFKRQVGEAFVKIQNAWQNQDLSKVRKFISDGIYQRFNTQFTMQKMLKQKNTIEDLNIKNVYIDKAESDGAFDIIHIAVHATINDKFISELDPSLNVGGFEEFVEYWSFIKKRGKPRRDIYDSDNCPNCGAPLPADMGEVSRCASCGTLTNTGEYDWVLSEITQADDYVASNPKLAKSNDLNEKVRSLINENDDFSVQLVEDKASNGYLQILTAMALNDKTIMRRFVSDHLFNKIQMPEPGSEVAYNRIYLNDVYLIGVSVHDNRNRLSIAIKSSFQRVKIRENRTEKIDQSVMSKTEIIIMTRDINSSAPKGSIYAHSCPSCGAPVENSLNITCAYCGNALNSTKLDWIITDIMSAAEYNKFVSSNKQEFSYSVSPSLIDKLYDVRDFAFNNAMVVLAADGEFLDEERAFAYDLAKKWGYDAAKIEPVFTMAAAGRLVIKMPEDAGKRKKIFNLMEKAAQADQNISQEEQQLLDSVKQQYGIE
jgi:uncharacterized Zn finger protein (UPF0148 family)/preprotein translocase subunit YajC